MLKKTDTLDNAMQLKKQMEEDYRFLHAHAETGFSLLKTHLPKLKKYMLY